MTKLILELVEVLAAIEVAKDSRDFSRIPALVERWQTSVNRLEEMLRAKRSIKQLREKIKRLEERVRHT